MNCSRLSLKNFQHLVEQNINVFNCIQAILSESIDLKYSSDNDVLLGSGSVVACINSNT